MRSTIMPITHAQQHVPTLRACSQKHPPEPKVEPPSQLPRVDPKDRADVKVAAEPVLSEAAKTPEHRDVVSQLSVRADTRSEDEDDDEEY